MQSQTSEYFRLHKIGWPAVLTEQVIAFQGEEIKVLPRYGHIKWAAKWKGQWITSKISEPRAAARRMAMSIATRFMEQQCIAEQQEQNLMLTAGSSGRTLTNTDESGIVHAPVCQQE